MIVRISNCDVVAGVRKIFEQMFHVGHSSSGRQALNNMMGRLSDDPPVVPAAIGLGPECPCGFAKGIRRYRLAAANDAAKLPVFAALRFGLSSV